MTSSTAATALDHDVLAALEEERTFLLRSLDDLEQEYAVGDIDDADYLELKDDYTRRAAEIIQSLNQGKAEFLAVAKGVRWHRALVWLVGLALLGSVSGLLLAHASGARSSGDEITGGVRQSVVTRLNLARGLLADQSQWDEAIDIYAAVLSENPSSVEALTYMAWLEYRQGRPTDSVLAAVIEAGRLDPDYPDAIVFNTIMLADEGRYAEAAAVLRRLDIINAPSPVVGLLNQRGLIGEVFGEATYEILIDEAEVKLGTVRLTSDAALAAAQYLLSTDRDRRTVSALKLFRAVLEVEPDNVSALIGEAMLLALTGEADLEERSVVLVDRAVAAQPRNPEALVSRASVFALLDRSLEQLCQDVDLVLSLDEVAAPLQIQAKELADQFCK